MGELSADQASRHTRASVNGSTVPDLPWLTPRRTLARSGNAHDLKRTARAEWIIVPGDGPPNHIVDALTLLPIFSTVWRVFVRVGSGRNTMSNTPPPLPDGTRT
jgi:hypothetical protein